MSLGFRLQYAAVSPPLPWAGGCSRAPGPVLGGDAGSMDCAQLVKEQSCAADAEREEVKREPFRAF